MIFRIEITFKPVVVLENKMRDIESFPLMIFALSIVDNALRTVFVLEFEEIEAFEMKSYSFWAIDNSAESPGNKNLDGTDLMRPSKESAGFAENDRYNR